MSQSIRINETVTGAYRIYRINNLRFDIIAKPTDYDSINFLIEDIFDGEDVSFVTAELPQLISSSKIFFKVGNALDYFPQFNNKESNLRGFVVGKDDDSSYNGLPIAVSERKNCDN